MPTRLGDRRWRRLAVIGVALHLVVVLTAQFEHHDILCHFKTPFHCTSCASNPLSVDAGTTAHVTDSFLADLGHAFAFVRDVQGALLTVSLTGRSPPSLPV
jgi:hypothetical protein